MFFNLDFFKGMVLLSNKDTPVITTNRLILRGKTKKDANAILGYYTDKNVRIWLGGYPPTELNIIKRILKKDNSKYSWAIILKETNQVIGEFDIYHIVEGRLAELGYILSFENWGKRYLTEVMQTMIPFAFNTIGLKRLRVSIMTDNKRSRKLVERMGFIYEAELKEADFGGRIENVCYYSLTPEDYKSVYNMKYITLP